MNTSRALTLFLALALLGLVFLALPISTARAADPVIVRVATFGTTDWPCGNQSDWSNPCALQTALTRSVSPAELWVAAGTYTPTTGISRTISFQLRNSIALYGGFAGTETLRSQRNITTHVTILSGDIGVTGNASDNSYYVVTAGSGVTNTAVLDGFTVTGGRADGGNQYSYGGGMNNASASPTVANVIFSNNAAEYEGGGMYNYYSNPTLTNVTFISNTALYGAGMTNNHSSPVVANAAFSDNSASPYDGGGMRNEYSSNPTVTNVTFTGNSASRGGGMFNANSSSPTLTNVTFSENSAASDGGGMYNWTGSPALTNVTFVSNTAKLTGGGMYNYSNPTFTNVAFISNTANSGGGVYNDFNSRPTLSNVTFSSNSAYYGGGMYNYDSAMPILTNVTFSGNSGWRGGGMYNRYGSNPVLTNVTFYSNVATDSGGGLWNDSPSAPPGSATVRNAIFWGNTAPSGSQISNVSNAPILSDSVVQGGYAYGTNILTTSPYLGPLGAWGGSTETVPLLPGSSAIDAGNTATCPATDQRGKPRVGACDIGAFESQGFTLTKTSGDNQSTPVNAAFAMPLGLTVSSASGEPVNGGAVTFTAPPSGASVIPATSTAAIASGTATQTLTANGTVGSYTVTASAAGASASVSFALTNVKHDTITVITSSENPVLAGHPVTFTVTVSAVPPGSIMPTGTVELSETSPASAALRTARRGLASQPLIDGVATFSLPSLTAGTHTFLATYSGDANNNASTSTVYSENVDSLDYYLPLLRR